MITPQSPYTQSNLLDAIEAERAAQKGIQAAQDHANAVIPNWSEQTYQIFVKEFLPQHKRFLAEEFRSWLAVNKPNYEFPPHNRAYGGIMRRAREAYYIIHIGTQKVSNVKAHCAFASVWETNTERLIENGIIK
jgi:hypothetical protein